MALTGSTASADTTTTVVANNACGVNDDDAHDYHKPRRP
jgi:hypothetical protein